MKINPLSPLLLPFMLEPDQYIGFPVLSADIGPSQIHGYWCICFPISANTKLFGFTEHGAEIDA